MVRNTKKEGNVLPTIIILFALVMVSFLPANAANAPQRLMPTVSAGTFLSEVRSGVLPLSTVESDHLLGTVSSSSDTFK